MHSHRLAIETHDAWVEDTCVRHFVTKIDHAAQLWEQQSASNSVTMTVWRPEAYQDRTAWSMPEKSVTDCTRNTTMKGQTNCLRALEAKNQPTSETNRRERANRCDRCVQDRCRSVCKNVIGPTESIVSLWKSAKNPTRRQAPGPCKLLSRFGTTDKAARGEADAAYFRHNSPTHTHTHFTHARRHPSPRTNFLFSCAVLLVRVTRLINCTLCAVPASLGRTPPHGAEANHPGPRGRDPSTGR